VDLVPERQITITSSRSRLYADKGKGHAAAETVKKGRPYRRGGHSCISALTSTRGDDDDNHRTHFGLCSPSPSFFRASNHAE
jgi:hypothetical protein